MNRDVWFHLTRIVENAAQDAVATSLRHAKERSIRNAQHAEDVESGRGPYDQGLFKFLVPCMVIIHSSHNK